MGFDLASFKHIFAIVEKSRRAHLTNGRKNPAILTLSCQ